MLMLPYEILVFFQTQADIMQDIIIAEEFNGPVDPRKMELVKKIQRMTPASKKIKPHDAVKEIFGSAIDSVDISKISERMLTAAFVYAVLRAYGPPRSADLVAAGILATDKKDFELASRIFRAFSEVFHDELKALGFLLLNESEAVLYQNWKAQYGPNTLLRFVDARLDLEAAVCCMCTGNSTACVFHLMRIMEVAVRLWARKLKIPLTQVAHKHTGDQWREVQWNDLATSINAKVQAMPVNTKARKDKSNEAKNALILLNNVRDAWRNSTMHPASHYTVEEGWKALQSVSALLEPLASII